MRKLDSLPSREVGFVEPMECLAVAKLPSGPEWVYEIKLDGYRALAINSNGRLSLFSRKRKSFNRQYPHIVEALHDLPKDTAVDGEIVALDDAGRPNFNLLQHSRSQASRICYFVFDLLVYEGRDLTQLTLIERREILNSTLKIQSPNIRIAQYFETSVATMLQSAREQGLEGVVAKRKNSTLQRQSIMPECCPVVRTPLRTEVISQIVVSRGRLLLLTKCFEAFNDQFHKTSEVFSFRSG